jgi:hypothetical protein
VHFGTNLLVSGWPKNLKLFAAVQAGDVRPAPSGGEKPSGTALWRYSATRPKRAVGWITPRDIFGGRSPQELTDTGDPAEQRRVLEVLTALLVGRRFEFSVEQAIFLKESCL